MRRPAILITGANGEIGHGLISALQGRTEEHLVGLDIEEIDGAIKKLLWEDIRGNILDRNLLDRVNSNYEITAIYHLAALLSTRAEFSPTTAHQVNVDGTLNLLTLAVEQSRTQGRPIKFFFPSSIAVYGLPGPDVKNQAGAVGESEYLFPQTMYGCNKLYCELLGTYYSRHYQRLAAEAGMLRVDFRAIRFPGLISAATVPSGGTSDYAPEMLHAAAQNKPYDCFVREDTTIPFMTMLDAIKATMQLMDAPRESLTQPVYNIMAFNPSAARFRERVIAEFSQARIGFVVNEARQAMVDSWPSNVDDSAARNDWNWQPTHDFEAAFAKHLIPHIRQRYWLD
ncbi:NAD-dependent epimerase/dehydratase family protein [Candidatus Neomarinimicrobiota bacterium]